MMVLRMEMMRRRKDCRGSSNDDAVGIVVAILVPTRNARELEATSRIN